LFSADFILRSEFQIVFACLFLQRFLHCKLGPLVIQRRIIIKFNSDLFNYKSELVKTSCLSIKMLSYFITSWIFFKIAEIWVRSCSVTVDTLLKIFCNPNTHKHKIEIFTTIAVKCVVEHVLPFLSKQYSLLRVSGNPFTLPLCLLYCWHIPKKTSAGIIEQLFSDFILQQDGGG